MFRKLFLPLTILLMVQSFAQGQTSGYYAHNALAMTSPGAMKYGLYGFDNPALLSTLQAPDMYFTWTKYKGNWSDAHQYGLFIAIPNLGFSAVNQKLLNNSVTDYRLAFSGGSEAFGFGMGYGWSKGDVDTFSRSSMWNIGLLLRPNQFLSIGATVNLPRTGNREGIFEAAIRPLKTEVVSIFGDYVAKKDRVEGEGKWSAGITIEALPGVRLTGRYFDTKTITAGVQFELGNLGISEQSYFNKDSKYDHNSYGIRMGAYDRNVFTHIDEGKKILTLNMLQGVDYQKFKLFDSRHTLSELLRNIEAAKNDPQVGGIAINASGMHGNREILWEVREKLKDFKSTEKKVTIFIDRGGLNEYHFASVADKIVMDPTGGLTFEGYLLGKNYFKGTLEKLGLGFDEFRFFKYKSAMETFSRDKMSDADREQLQKIADDWYRLAQEDVVSSGRITKVQFDSLINTKLMVLPSEALSLGLVDKLVRWDSPDKMIEDNTTSAINASMLESNKLPKDNYWGAKPEIALIYALGACDMEDGIAARSLVRDVNRAVENSNVKAIVLRVDSPGGDAMASDYITAALQKAKGKKPVIVSQGRVAGSGGYWLSMYADTIVAAPSTITGSIGVIGGWIYNKGFKEMLGGSTDFVKKGDHAEVGFGFAIPLLGVSVPDRALTTEERAKVESSIRSMYKEFVGKVAEGRKKSFEYIHSIGEGRVWSGYDGLKIGLVDVLGGLETAINIAKTKSGLKNGEYNLVEYPDSKMIDFGMFMPKIISTSIETDPVLKNLKYRLQYNGQALYIVPFDFAMDTND